jgi:hypothetical protein
MDFADHRNPVVGQAFHEVHLPQRAAAVQRRAGDLPDGLVQFASAAGRGHPPRADVVVEVDLAVLPPHRVVEAERDLDELVAERIQLVQPSGDDLPERGDVQGAPIGVQFDDGGLDGVHVHVRCFAVQQYRVPAAKPLHRCPLPIEGPYSAQAAQMTSFAPIRVLLR